MKIRIYQINDERDENRVRFVNYEHLPRFQGTQEIQSGIYDLVFDGEVDCKDHEDVYRMFNAEHPEGFRGHSLSVSDVIEVQDQDGENSFCFCDSFGFREVEFDVQQCGKLPEREKSKQIKVLLLQPRKTPKPIEIENTLEAMQAVVGGDIEEYAPFDDDVVLICNEEGKLRGLPLNRAIRSESEEVDLPYEKMKDLFREAEKTGAEHLQGYIVFSKDSFDTPYPVESRTYLISSDNKAFNCNAGGYSIFGSSLDGSDKNVRLDYYMADERGGKDGWKIERCYTVQSRNEIQDVICGDFFLAYAPPECEEFMSLPDDLLHKYQETFRYPERFYQTRNGIQAVPYDPAKEGRDR